MTSLYSNTFFLCVLRLSFFYEIKAWYPNIIPHSCNISLRSIFCTHEWLKVKTLLQFSFKTQKFLTSNHRLLSSFSKLYGGQKKISSPQFLSYDHQNFFGITSNDLEGRHVFIFSILYRKKLIFDFLVTLVRFFTHNSQISLGWILGS